MQLNLLPPVPFREACFESLTTLPSRDARMLIHVKFSELLYLSSSLFISVVSSIRNCLSGGKKKKKVCEHVIKTIKRYAHVRGHF